MRRIRRSGPPLRSIEEELASPDLSTYRSRFGKFIAGIAYEARERDSAERQLRWAHSIEANYRRTHPKEDT